MQVLNFHLHLGVTQGVQGTNFMEHMLRSTLNVGGHMVKNDVIPWGTNFQKLLKYANIICRYACQDQF